MADILFVIKDPRLAVAGAIERIHVSIPFMKQRVDPNTRMPMVNPQTGQPVMMPDAEAAWNWVKSQGFHFPPNVPFTGIIRNPVTMPDHGPPIVLCYQLSHPKTSESFVNAGQPDAQMAGNPSNGVNLPPRVGRQTHYGGPNGEVLRADPFEPVHASGVPRTQDSMMGENDPQGGTFTDISPLDDQERKRSLDPQKPGEKPQLTPEIVWGFAIQWYADGFDMKTNKPRWTRVHPESAYQQAYQKLKASGQYAA